MTWPGDLSAAFWLGESGPLLDAVRSLIDIFHVYDVRALRRALRHGMAACVVVDSVFPDPEVEAFLETVRQDWPYTGIVALVDAPPDAIILDPPFADVDRCLSRYAEPAALLAVVRELNGWARRAQLDREDDPLRDRARQLEGLLRGTLRLSGTVDPDDILGNLREVARVAVDADDMAVLLTTDNYADLGDALRLGAPGGYAELCGAFFRALPLGERLDYIGEEVLLRERIPDMLASAWRVREAEAAGAWSYMRLPLSVDQRLIGFVALFSQVPGLFNGAHLQLGRLFAGQVTVAVRNRELFVQLNRAEAHQQSVSDVARLLAEDMTLDDALSRIVAEAVRLAGGQSGSVLLVQPDRSLIVSAAVDPAPGWLGYRVGPGVGQVGMIAITGRPSVVIDYASWDYASEDLRAMFPPHAVLLGVPLRYRNLVLGVLQVVREPDAPGDPQDALDVLVMLAPQAATAIAKAQLHEAVLKERRQFQVILNHTPAAVVVSDALGRILLANPTAERLLARLGFPMESIRGQRVGDLLAPVLPDDAPELTRETRAVEVRLGSVGEYAVHIAPITRPDGELDGYVGVAQEVTEMRRLDRMKSSLNRVLTHDLGNLLMLAQNPLQLMDEPDLLPEQREQLKQMLTGSLERMEALLKDVMELEMMPSFDQQTVVSYELSALAQQTVERNQDSARRHQIALTYEELEPQPPTLEGHAVLIMQAIDNLVTNAVKYTPDGGEVRCAIGAEGGYAFVRVEDTGYGIPADKLHAIFEPFVRVKDPRTRHIQGTGLGLNLVKTFVEAHGGHVTVESEIDAGSVFTIYLPLEPVDLAQTPSSGVATLDLSALARNDSGE
jgi:PAS domain S-box-containing protein